MRVLIVFALATYAFAAPSHLKEAEEDVSVSEFNLKALKKSEKIQENLAMSSRRLLRSAEEIESSTVGDDVNKGVSEANNLTEFKELAEEARWAAEEKKWQEQAEAETASARLDAAASSIETTTISENQNEKEDEANENQNEEEDEAEEKQWAEEEKKWQEKADADTEAAVLDGISASKEGEQSDTEEIENVENALPAAGIEILNDLPKYEINYIIFPQIATIPNYNLLSNDYSEAHNHWGYQFARIYAPEIYSPY